MNFWCMSARIGILGAIAGLNACAVLGENQPQDPGVAEAQASNQALKQTPDQTSNSESIQTISFQKALAIAESVAEGSAYAIEREVEDNKPIIEVEVGEQEVLIEAQSGEIFLIENVLESGDEDDIEEVAAILKLQKLVMVSIGEALAAAEQLTNSAAHTVELKNEVGNLVYEVIVDLQAIYVDAGTGEVLAVETVGQGDGIGWEKPSSIQVPVTENSDDDDN